MAIAKSKLALIHVAKKQLGLSEDDYRSILVLFGGVETSADLTDGGFERVMARFQALGFNSTSTAKPLPKRANMASPAQTSLIRHLWHDYTSGAGTDVSLGKWLEGHFHVSSIRFVTAATAPKVITALKAMARKKAHAHPAA